MSLNAAAIRLLAEKGLSAADIAELAEIMEVRKDPTAAERMRRYRAKKASGDGVTVTRNVTENTPPNDNISNPPGLTPVSNETGPLFSEIVVSAWNEMADANGLAPARKLSPSRLKHLKARIREHSEEAVLEAIRKLGESDWHCGRSASGWCADLGWLLKNPENFQKILERSSVNGRHTLSPEPGVNARAAHGFVFGP